MLAQNMIKYYPMDEWLAQKRALILWLQYFAVFAAAGISLFFAEAISFGDACLIFCVFFLTWNAVRYHSFQKEEQKLLKGLEVFLGELRFEYSFCKRIDEALEECAGRQDSMISLHARQIADSLEEGEEAYIRSAPNRFLALFCVFCQIMYQNGDRIVNGQSVCLSNLGIMKEAVETEYLRQKQIEHAFSGLIFLCIFPLLFVKAIETWAISNMEELKLYYRGSYGMITTLLLCLSALLCFTTVSRLRYERPLPGAERVWLKRLAKVKWIEKAVSWKINRNYFKYVKLHRLLKECAVSENIKEFVILQYVTACVCMLFSIAGLCSYQAIYRKQIVYKTEHMFRNVYQVRGEQKKQAEERIEAFVTGKENPDADKLILQNGTDILRQTVQKQLEAAARQWKTWGLPWYVYGIVPVSALAGFYGRYGFLLLRKRGTGRRREEEILIFQSLILCLMYMERMSGEEILQWLEKVAFYFRDSISGALYRLIYQDYEEAQQIKEEENMVSMVMILEGILACDRLPVEEAFMQMESDYQYTRQSYMQECRKEIQDKSAISRVIAFVPLYLTVGLKLIVPFVLEGISRLSAYAESMEQFM